MRKHYLALLIISILLACSIDWIYRMVARSLGEDLALIALTLTIMIVVAFVTRGVIYASRLESFLQGQATALKNPPHPGSTVKPFELKLFGVVLFRYPELPFEFQVETQAEDGEVYQLDAYLCRKPLGKQPRFPEEKIRKAVLKWERRDRSFSARTLEEFLDQEFGTGSDGILLMAPTTFYGWRKRILSEIHAKSRS